MDQELLRQVDRILASYFGPLKESVEANKFDPAKLPAPQVTVPEVKVPTINVPDIKVPEIVIPEIRVPTVHVPKPEVTVNVDEVNIKNWPEFPKQDNSDIIKELKKLQNKTSGGGGANSTTFFDGTKYIDVSSTNPLPVTIGSATLSVNLDAADDEVTVYGSQGVALQQKATTNDLIVTLDSELVGLKDSTGTDLSLTAGGVYGLKVHVVGDSDKYVRGNIAHDAVDSASDPVNIGGTASTSTPSAVANGHRVRAYFDATGHQHTKVDAMTAVDLDIRDLTHVTDSVKIGDGTDTATVASALDSRNGLDIQHSSVASKQLLYFHSDEPAHRLLATESKLFPTDIPGGSTWFDLNGYLGFQCDWVDNSSGAGSATLYAIWSEDQVAYAENFPVGGNTQALFTTADNNVHKFIPRQGRYVKLMLVNGSVDEGTVVPNIAILKLTAVPAYFTNSVNITSVGNQVVGPTDIAVWGLQPVIVGGVDNAGSPTLATPIAVSTTGQAAVQGTAGTYTGTPLITTQKLATTATVTRTTTFSAATSTQIAASSTSRIGCYIYNDTTQTMLVKFGTACSPTSFLTRIPPQTLWEVDNIKYSGVIHAYFAAATSGTDQVLVSTT